MNDTMRPSDAQLPSADPPGRPSWVARLLAPILRKFMKERLRRLASGDSVDVAVVERSRRRLERIARLGGTRERGVRFERRTIGGVPVEVVTPAASRPGVCVLYVHGGAFALGSPRTHRSITRHIALATRARAIVPEYRLAPEHPYPAALTDLLAVYRALPDEGVDPKRVVCAGESAGGNLVVALGHAHNSEGATLPAGLVCLSPWADPACTGESLAKHRELDTMVPVEAMPLAARMYAGAHDLRTPTISPLYGDFRGLPPLLVHVSSSEVLYDDGLRVVRAAQEAGVDAELRVWPLVPHAFPAFVDILPEARAAVAEIARFVERVVP
jgi:acetyl esterase/lipase